MGPILTFIAALLAAVAAILLAEGGARLWLRFAARTYPWRPRMRMILQPDRAILPRLSAETTFQTNSLGLRGREAPTAKRVHRIVMCGGSAVECLSLDETEAWPYRVERQLAAPATKALLGVDDVHVLTLAKSGFTNAALAYLFPRVLDRLGPIDVLTLTTGASVLNAWSLAGAPAQPVAQFNAWDDIDWHGEQQFAWRPPVGLDGLALAEILRRLRHRWWPAAPRVRKTGRSIAIGRAARDNARDMRDTAPDPALWIAQYELELGQLIIMAARYARRVVLIRQPWFDKADPSREEAAQFWHGFAFETDPSRRQVFYSHRLLCEMLGRLDAATLRVADRYGVATIRLADALPPSVDVFYDFLHLTPEGARRATDLVATELLALELGEPQAAPEAAYGPGLRPMRIAP